PTSTLWRHPNNILRWVLNIASFAVHAVLSVDLEARIAGLIAHKLVHPGWTVALLRSVVECEVHRDRDGRVLERQVRGLVLLVVCVGNEYRGELVESYFAVGLWVV